MTSSLLTNVISGLTNTYSVLASQYPQGVTLEDLLKSVKNTTVYSNLNSSFLSYLTSNFKNIDTNGDGKIDANDMNSLLNSINTQGLTYNEIVQLCNQGNCDTSLMNTVLRYFNKIDTNGDGKVSNSEINAFKLKAEEEKMKTEMNSFKASSMSVFYSDGTDETPSSLIDNLYPDFDSDYRI